MEPFLENMEQGFLVERTMMKNTTFHYKTVLSKTNVKRNKIGSAKRAYHLKWGLFTTYHLKWGLFTNYFMFLKIYFEYVIILMSKYPNVQIHIFSNCLNFILLCIFPVSILKQ